jgi:hypothetical protein
VRNDVGDNVGIVSDGEVEAPVIVNAFSERNVLSRVAFLSTDLQFGLDEPGGFPGCKGAVNTASLNIFQALGYLPIYQPTLLCGRTHRIPALPNFVSLA